MNKIGYFVKIKEKINNLYKKDKRLFFVLVVLFLALVCVFFIPTNKKSKNNQTNEINQQQLFDSDDYSSYVENKIKTMLLKLSNISFVDVFVVCESSLINNYQTQKESTKTTNSSGETIVEKEEIVFEKNGSSQSPILITITNPKILSVMLVLNKVDASTKLSIKNAVAGVLNISVDCIFILQDG